MDWENVKLLLAVKRAASVRGAARHLSVDPSTVSRRLQQLEESVGTSLVERDGTKLRMTEAGLALAAAAAQMESQLKAATRSIERCCDEPSGQVRVSFPQILGRPIQKLLAQVPLKFPQLSLELACSDQVVSLAAGEAEIVVRMEESPPAQLVGRRVGALSLGLYSTRAYQERRELSLQEGQQHHWVDWGPVFRRKAAMQWLEEAYPGRHVVAVGESGQAVLDAIEADMGVGILARLHAEHLHEWELLPAEACPSIWLLTTREARTRAGVSVVLEELQRFSEVYAAHLNRGRPIEFESPQGHNPA